MPTGRTKTGRREMNPTDAYRKQQRKREIKKNRKERKKVREVSALLRDPEKIMAEIHKMEAMDQQGMLDHRLRHKLLQLRQTYSAVVRRQRAQGQLEAKDERRRKELATKDMQGSLAPSADPSAQGVGSVPPPQPPPITISLAPGPPPPPVRLDAEGKPIGPPPAPPRPAGLPQQPGTVPPPPPPRLTAPDGTPLAPPPPPPRKIAVDPLDPEAPTYTERTVAYTAVGPQQASPSPALASGPPEVPPPGTEDQVPARPVPSGPMLGPAKPKAVNKDMLRFMPTTMRVKRKGIPTVSAVGANKGVAPSGAGESNNKAKVMSLPAVPMPAGARLLAPSLPSAVPGPSLPQQPVPGPQRPPRPAAQPPSSTSQKSVSAGGGGVEDEYASFMDELSKLG
mmetsp:Transcript_5138/g.7108  ORF Transcript_5138/g.7108 Transcript_5138/m.7108 type:complete len:395 (-) Transcript_5138:119-1303(-)|eukprot:CAMPEP_0117744800 /NCGR_PEP_ID=MMETSP0947-20121206/6981_1 /TAXON_ID=44440 /ORGANISM="Chattonella subsalsa, Strain CCMP2191" /LENGTH=394 /DNA_ID=CAMNT_0005561831 /DNA_START=50 /DNA_END=1234 /DNA_ORIENTATION=+